MEWQKLSKVKKDLCTLAMNYKPSVAGGTGKNRRNIWTEIGREMCVCIGQRRRRSEGASFLLVDAAFNIQPIVREVHKWYAGCTYVALFSPCVHSKRFVPQVTFTRSHTHSYAEGGSCHSGCRPAHRKHFGVKYLAQGHIDLWTGGPISGRPCSTLLSTFSIFSTLACKGSRNEPQDRNYAAWLSRSLQDGDSACKLLFAQVWSPRDKY